MTRRPYDPPRTRSVIVYWRGTPVNVQRGPLPEMVLAYWHDHKALQKELWRWMLSDRDLTIEKVRA